MHGTINHVASYSVVDMELIPEADVFIPEACKVCIPEEKKLYHQWIDNTLIPELIHQNIRFVDRSKAYFKCSSREI